MRQNAWPRSVYLALGAIGVLIFLGVRMSSSKGGNKEAVRTWRKRENVEYLCQQEQAEQYNGRPVLAVPMDQVMSGKPLVLPQDDPRVIEYIWANHHIQPPSGEPYNLKAPNVDPSMGQGQFIRKILKDMTGGFFVECGALDGETRSNSLFLETKLNWKGLLVEGSPSNFEMVKTKNRKAWMANTCLAVKPYPHTATFKQDFNIGKIVGEEEENVIEEAKYVDVQCMPLYALLSAINVTTVDYFSLDVEGSELKVLKTIPFDKINIRTLSVEFAHTTEGEEELLKFMQSQGYRKVGEVRHEGNLANDFIFARNDVPIDDYNNNLKK